MFELQKNVEIGDAAYMIRSMDGRMQMALFHDVREDGSTSPEAMYDLLEKCITDWTGAKNLRGEPMGDFERGKVAWLAFDVAARLFAEVMELSTPSEEQKKSSSISPSSVTTPKSSPVASVPATPTATTQYRAGG